MSCTADNNYDKSHQGNFTSTHIISLRGGVHFECFLICYVFTAETQCTLTPSFHLRIDKESVGTVLCVLAVSMRRRRFKTVSNIDRMIDCCADQKPRACKRH